jgi:hypothetical protein
MIGKRLRRKRARPSREDILKSVVALARYVGRDHHGAPAAASTQSAGKGIGRLFRYLLDSSSNEDADRVDAGGAFNLFGSAPEAWEAQLVAAADQCPARCDPLEHYVLSWPQSERPSAIQLEAAARTLMRELGFGKCPAVWAAHNDTDNLHLHVAVVRFDLETGKAAGLAWDIDALHQAIAIIEHEHGWKPERDAIFRIEGSLMREVQTGAPVRDLKTGESFPRRRGQDRDHHMDMIATQLLHRLYCYDNWEQFHSEAAFVGLRYVRKGSGASVHSRKGIYKASAIDPGLALPRLEAKFGPYEGRRGEKGTTYEGYERSYSSCLDQLRAAQAAARQHLEKVRKDQRDELAALLAEANAKAVLLAINQAVDREIAAAREAMDEAYRKAKKDLFERRLDRAAWEAAGEPALINPVPPPTILFPSLSGSQPVAPAFGGGLVRHGHEQQASEFIIEHRYGSGRVAFTDHRAMLIVHDAEREAICAALELAHKRWGAALVSGSEAFRDQCKAFGAELGIKVIDGGQPAQLVPKSKESTTGLSKRSSDPAPKKQLPSARPLHVALAREEARSRADLALQNNRALESLATDAETSQQRGAAPTPAKAMPVAGSVATSEMPQPGGLPPAGDGAGRVANSPPDTPFRPPNKRGGWER